MAISLSVALSILAPSSVTAVGLAVALAVLVVLIISSLTDYRTNAPSADTPYLGGGFQVFMRRNDLLDWLTEMTELYAGRTWAFTLPFKPKFIVATNPDVCEYFLKTNFDNYVKGEEFNRNFHDFLGTGIFNVDGEEWKSQRKQSSHMFNVKTFRNEMMEVFVKHGHKLESKLEDAMKSGEVVDMNDLFMRYTLDSIGDVGFGYEINSLDNPSHPFARSFDYVQYLGNLRFLIPRALHYCNLMEYQATSHLAKLDEIARQCIRQHVESKEERHDFLSIFMKARGFNGTEADVQFYRDLIMNFTIAGRDTTGQALSWMFWLLDRHPNVQQKLLEEIDREIGDADPTYDTVNNLTYADAVFSETLRLYPSVPKDGKFAVKDDVLPDGTVVPAGALVMYVPYTMGRLESLWGKDAKEFNPERWLDGTPRPSPFKFIAFQAGPRTCLGQRMAYIEAKVVMCMILKQFRLRAQNDMVPRYSLNVTLSMEGGLPMSVCAR